MEGEVSLNFKPGDVIFFTSDIKMVIFLVLEINLENQQFTVFALKHKWFMHRGTTKIYFNHAEYYTNLKDRL